MSDEDEERTDPNIQLPELAPLRSSGLTNEEHTLDMDPLPPPPRHPNRPATPAADVEGPPTDRPAQPAPATPPPLPARHRLASSPPQAAGAASHSAPASAAAQPEQGPRAAQRRAAEQHAAEQRAAEQLEAERLAAQRLTAQRSEAQRSEAQRSEAQRSEAQLPPAQRSAPNAVAPLPASQRAAPDPRSALPPAARLPSVPSGAVARPIAPAKPERSGERLSGSPSSSTLDRASAAARSARISNPPPARRDSRPPPPLRPGSIPPSRMPKPSDPPPPRSELNPPQRQRLAQMETHLDGARSTIARQRNEIEELRARLEAREQRLDGFADQLSKAPSQEALDERVSQLEERRDAIASELRARMENAERGVDGRDGRFGGIEARLDRLEEDGDTVRLRMRQETMNHRLRKIDARLGGFEEALTDLRRSLADAQARDHRLERLEAMFEEFHAELVEQRARTGAEALAQRMDDLEALVVKSGAAIDMRRDTLEAQLARVEKISESLPPPPLAPAMQGDDLTRIKGIGPKFARLLAGAGVGSFEAMAAWDEAETARVAAAIGVKVSRITKAGWVASAARLCSGP